MCFFRAPLCISALATLLLASCGGGDSSGSNNPTVPPTNPPPPPPVATPTAPSTLTATVVSTTQINLSWAASTDNVGVTEYRIERCATAGCTNYAQITTSTTTAFNNTGLAASTTYQYRVRAANAAGGLSAYSPIAVAITLTPDTQPPSAPLALTATAIASSQINLSWMASADNVGVTAYQLERCQGVACSTFMQIAAPATLAYSDAGLVSATTYSYRVRAVDAATNLSAYSSSTSATTTATPTGPITRSAGCGTAPSSLTVRYVPIMVEGASRQYYFVPPTNYDRNRAYKVVFGFHGRSGRGQLVRTDLDMEANATGEAFYIYPDGQDVPGEGFGWDTFNSESQDVHLVDKIVTDLKAGWCINPKAIFANGFSWGGWMSNHIACARPDTFRGIIAIAGGGPDQCTLTKPVAAMIIHGSADTQENIRSGIASRDKFIASNRCSTTTSSTSLSLCVTYNGCAAGQPVYWCEHHPADTQQAGSLAGGHTVPDFIKRDGAWSFFNSLPRKFITLERYDLPAP